MKQEPTPQQIGLHPLPESKYINYQQSIQPILNRRCVVCHSCNDAPCQLNLGAYAGVDRGASKIDLYENRLLSTEPTRLFVDAKSTNEWRTRGFFPTIQHYPPGDERNLSQSILFHLITYRKYNPLPRIRYDSFTSRSCPNLASPLPRLAEGLGSLLKISPFADLGMPYGLPALSNEDYATLHQWLLLGAPGDDSPSEGLPEVLHESISNAEIFLNGMSAKEKLVSRYLYEHLVYAHLYFPGVEPAKSPTFFRLVRSATPSPEAIEELSTRLPYESPTRPVFYYRLKKVEGTIVHKTHLALPFGKAELQHLKQLFLNTNWTLSNTELPDYQLFRSANPFLTFEKIPARARYQFMLDHADYFVGSFMKGPVCRGQLALNVIDDYFFIFFLNPNADQAVTNVDFLAEAKKHLVTPFRNSDLFSGSSESNDWSLLELPLQAASQIKSNFYPYFKNHQLRYLKLRDMFYSKSRPKGYRLEDIWDGEKKNKAAALTVFRHFDSASVVAGTWGREPKTALILDYPIFERMYYNLIASFDIFSDIKSQLATRLYMDDLRIEAEDLFLSFLPLEKRIPIRKSWYERAEHTIMSNDYPFYGTDIGTKRDTQIEFRNQENPKRELFSIITNRYFSSKEKDPFDRYNFCSGVVDANGTGSKPFQRFKSEREFWKALSSISDRSGLFPQVLPDLSLVRIRGVDVKNPKDLVVSLVHNREHYNVKYLFSENLRLKKELDTLSILPGYVGSYPNLFFDVPFEHAHEFLNQVLDLREDNDSFTKLIDRFGIRRTDSAHFWELSDWLNDHFQASDPINAGLLDLNRYENY